MVWDSLRCVAVRWFVLCCVLRLFCLFLVCGCGLGFEVLLFGLRFCFLTSVFLFWGWARGVLVLSVSCVSLCLLGLLFFHVVCFVVWGSVRCVAIRCVSLCCVCGVWLFVLGSWLLVFVLGVWCWVCYVCIWFVICGLGFVCFFGSFVSVGVVFYLRCVCG